MAKLDGRILLPLAPALEEWLAQKEKEGYKKTTFIRHVLELYIRAESEGRVELLKTVKGPWEGEKGKQS